MKSEERHELQANELEKLTEYLGKFFEKHGSKVLIGLAAAAVVGVGIYFGLGLIGKTNEEASTQIASAQTAEQYLAIADNPDYSDVPARTMARLKASEMLLAEGIRQYFTGRKAGFDELKRAQDNFKKVLETNGDDLSSQAKERALYGLAICNEAMSSGETKEAIQAYETLLKEFPETNYKAMAENRIAALKTNRAQEFYAFLSSSDRKPLDIKQPSDTVNGIKLPAGHAPITTPTEKPIELPRIPTFLSRDLGPDTTTEKKPSPFVPPSPSPKKTGETGPELKSPTKSKPAPVKKTAKTTEKK
jgi:tetratricopeptide (TPR) repeat protein